MAFPGDDCGGYDVLISITGCVPDVSYTNLFVTRRFVPGVSTESLGKLGTSSWVRVSDSIMIRCYS